MSPSGEIRRENKCWDVGISPARVSLADCHGNRGNQEFKYLEVSEIYLSYLQLRSCYQVSPSLLLEITSPGSTTTDFGS